MSHRRINKVLERGFSPKEKRAQPAASATACRPRGVAGLARMPSPAACAHSAPPRPQRTAARRAAPAATARQPAGARSAAALGQSPGVGVGKAVVEGLDALGPLAAGELVGVCSLEEAGGQLHQPLGVDLADLGVGGAAGGGWLGGKGSAPAPPPPSFSSSHPKTPASPHACTPWSSAPTRGTPPTAGGGRSTWGVGGVGWLRRSREQQQTAEDWVIPAAGTHWLGARAGGGQGREAAPTPRCTSTLARPTAHTHTPVSPAAGAGRAPRRGG